MIDWVTVLTRVLDSIINTAQLVLRGEASAQEALDIEFRLATIVAVMPGSWNGNTHTKFNGLGGEFTAFSASVHEKQRITQKEPATASFEKSKKEIVIDKRFLEKINDELLEDRIEHEANPHPYDRYFAADCDSEEFNRMFPRQRRVPELFVRRIRPEQIQAEIPHVAGYYECPSPGTLERMTPMEMARERRRFIRTYLHSSSSDGTRQEHRNAEEARDEETRDSNAFESEAARLTSVPRSSPSISQPRMVARSVGNMEPPTEGGSNYLLDNHLERTEGARDRPITSSHHDLPSGMQRVAPREEIDEKERFHVALIDFRGNCAVCAIRDASGDIEKYGTCLGEVTSDVAGAVLRARKESAKRRRRERRRQRNSDFVRIRNELFMDSLRAEQGPL